MNRKIRNNAGEARPNATCSLLLRPREKERIEVPCGKAQHHSDGTTKEHQGPYHHERAQKEPEHGVGPAAWPELLLQNRNNESGKNYTKYLRSHVRYVLSRMDMQGTDDVPEEACDAQPHVPRVSKYDKNYARKPEKGPRYKQFFSLIYHQILLNR